MKVRPLKSVYIKLFYVYILTFVFIIFGTLIIKVISSSSKNVEISIDNLRYYASGLTTEIGTPPDLKKAQEITDETGVQINILGPNMFWSSIGEHLEDEEDDYIWKFIPIAHDAAIEITRGDFTYSYNEFHADYLLSFTILIIMIITIIFALMVNFLMVRHQFKPLKKMYLTALEFGVSDWKQRVNLKGDDELATLAGAMDAMADRIESYVISMHDLLVAISHELRSPLTRMKVALEFITNNEIKDSLNEEIDTLDKLTGTLLKQRRLATQNGILNIESVQLHEWIKVVCEPYKNQKVDLNILFNGPERTCYIDSSQMEMVLRNLIENCLKHAPSSPIKILINTSKPNGFKIDVSDQGPGMVETLVGRVGEPFLLGEYSRSGKRNGGGFGLGLSIVKAVVEAHRGEFSAKNLIPNGFSVSLVFQGRDTSE